MQELKKLKGTIRSEADGSMTFFGHMHDKTEFSLRVTENDVEKNDPFSKEQTTVNGWLFVIQEAQQDSRCYLTLPKPSIKHGKQVVVHEYSLMPRHASINDFKPKRQHGKNKLPIPQEIS